MQHLRFSTGVCEKNVPRLGCRMGLCTPHPRISMLPATATRVCAAAKKTFLFVPCPLAPWPNIEIRGVWGGHGLCTRNEGRNVFFADTGLNKLCLCVLSRRDSCGARIFSTLCLYALSRRWSCGARLSGCVRMRSGPPCSTFFFLSLFSDIWNVRSVTRVVFCASKGANPR